MWKYDGSSTDETNIFAEIRFDAVMTNTNDNLVECVTSSETGNENESQEADIQSFEILMSRGYKGEAVPPESLLKLKLMLSIAASNL